jgi:transcriptional regulator with GAF, ATPase, and Fis domain
MMAQSESAALVLLLWQAVAEHVGLERAVVAVAAALGSEVEAVRLAVVFVPAPPARAALVAGALPPGVGVPDLERALPAVGLVRVGGAVVAVDSLERDADGATWLVVAAASPVAAERALSLCDGPVGAALRTDREVRAAVRGRAAAEAEALALRHRLGRAENEERIIGAEGGLRGVLQQVSQVAPTDVPVLILGETGSGKELIARAIHSGSRRADGPFLRVNCGAIPAELVDSELFGHERGSFTGATGPRRGWFERADGGTLFLDELGELPAAAQVRLLRVLQDGTFERVGGQRSLRADVRVVAATHRDLPSLVREGRFRQDLWFRLAVFPVELPPLRARQEDLPALASHFAARAGRRLRGVPLQCSVADLRLLARYDWPGNVRELGAVIERAAILGEGRSLAVAAALGALPVGPSAPAPSAFSPTWDELGRAVIEDALRRARGRIEGRGGAAERLGVKPSTLRSRMKRLGVGRPDLNLGQ